MAKRGRPFGSFKGKYPKKINGKVTRAHTKWCSMINRCYQKSHPAYRVYHSRGITVCDRWLGKNGFDNFVDDMGEPPAGLTLERKNNNLGYSKENCRWATWKEQANNRRQRGPTDTASLHHQCVVAGLPYHQVYFRINRLGWTKERALSTSIRVWAKKEQFE